MMHPPVPVAKGSPEVTWGARLKESLLYTRRTALLVFRTAPTLARLFVGLTLFGAVVPLGIAYVGKHLVDAVVARREGLAIRLVVLELALVLVMASVGRSLKAIRQILGARLGIDVNVAILEKAQSLSLRDFEDAEFYDRMTRARREASSRPLALVTDSFELLASILGFLGYAALLLAFSPVVVLGLLLATVPATVAETRFSKQGFKLKNFRSPDSRKLAYLEYVLANDEHVKEVKLFGLGPLFLGRYKALSEEFFKDDRKLIVKRAWVTQALSSLATLALYGTYVAVALFAVRGRITLGEMTLYVTAFRQGQVAFQQALSSLGSLYEHNLYMSNLFTFLGIEVAEAAPREGGVNGEELPGRGSGRRGDIVLENVGFRYPNKEEWALRGIDLVIPGGERVALVGQNGAGKTTLIKLLTRLYEPTEGRILLDGKDLRDWGSGELLSRFGVVFQDFNQYQLTFRENVGVGSVPHMGEAPRIARAVHQGGAESVLSGLSGGLEAPLGNWFHKGTELSGGQWQRVALSRAFMREEADILVLDEPTAALDAEAEKAVFDRFQELSRGRTTFVISHRFPTVRMADRILVLEGGRITESGTHDQLVARDGTYARLFAIQAQGYL